MIEKISRGIFWALSIGMILFGIANIFFINRSMILQSLILLIIGIVLNPKILDKIIKKVFKTETPYSFILIYLGVILVFYSVYVLFIYINIENIDEEEGWKNFESILRIVMYIAYVGIIFLNKNGNKIAKYITFGVIYFICVILSFASLQVHYVIMNLLNIIFSSDLDFVAYEMLLNDVLTPIKEAILTYIIFDTIMGNEKGEKGKNEDLLDEISENNDKVKDNKIMQTFELEVFDGSNKEKIKYKIRIQKR